MSKKKGFKAVKQGKPAAGDINVTPLIDVVLVLLIIYMVVTPVMLHKMQAELPDKTETVEEEDLPEEQILVAACKDGEFALNHDKIEIPMLIDNLRKKVLRRRRALRKKGEKDHGVVFIDGHPEVSYRQMVLLMDAVQEAGQQAKEANININVKIGLASLKEEKDFMACSPLPSKAAPAPGTAPATVPTTAPSNNPGG